jgi:hypothetical protein
VPSRERWRARWSGGERLTPPIVIYIGRGGDSRDGSAHGDWLACFGCLALLTLRRAFSRARRVRSVGGGWPQSEARRASVSRRAIQRHADESPASTVEDGDDGIRVRHTPSEQAQNDQERPDGARVPRATGLTGLIARSSASGRHLQRGVEAGQPGGRHRGMQRTAHRSRLPSVPQRPLPALSHARSACHPRQLVYPQNPRGTRLAGSSSSSSLSLHSHRASWLNMVEAWFSIRTRKSVRRGSFDTVRALVKHIQQYIAHWNDHPTPFVWTREPAAIIRKARRRVR